MDEDEKYNRKLESGLYTLQVRFSVLHKLMLRNDIALIAVVFCPFMNPSIITSIFFMIS